MIWKFRRADCDLLKWLKPSIWAASIESLNDPFEICFPIDFSAMSDLEIEARARIALENDNKNDVNLKSATDRLKRSRLDGEFTELAKQAIKEKIGICSFSLNPCNLLLWVHYADCFNGVAIGYDEPSLSKDILQISQIQKKVFPNPVQKVLYSKYKQVISSADPNFIMKSICTKAINWKYEEETRGLIAFDENSCSRKGGSIVTVVQNDLSVP